MTIDLKTRPYSPSLYARLLWQELFNYYIENGGNTKQMDSFLCDLITFQKLMSKQAGASTFWWVAHFETGYTDIQMDSFLCACYDLSHPLEQVPLCRRRVAAALLGPGAVKIEFSLEKIVVSFPVHKRKIQGKE